MSSNMGGWCQELAYIETAANTLVTALGEAAPQGETLAPDPILRFEAVSGNREAKSIGDAENGIEEVGKIGNSPNTNP